MTAQELNKIEELKKEAWSYLSDLLQNGLMTDIEMMNHFNQIADRLSLEGLS